jgi:hypothetical protein
MVIIIPKMQKTKGSLNQPPSPKRPFTRREAIFEPKVSKDHLSGSTLGRVSLLGDGGWLRRVPYWGALALLIYMPLHIFLSQSLSLVTGGLEVWKLAKDVVLVLLVVFAVCLVWQQRVATRGFQWLVALTILYFALHLVLWVANPDLYDRSALLGTIYNVRLPCFVLLGYGATLLNPRLFVFSSIFKIVLGVSTVVAFLGVLQYLLPKDLLTHVGYSLERGTRPAFFIDDNPAWLRIMSTLREPNALGAYLVLPFTALSLLIVRARRNRQRLLLIGAWALHALAILLTFSRSAWLGAALAVLLVVVWQYRRWMRAHRQLLGIVVTGIILVIGVGFLGLRHTPFFQQYIVHSDPNEQVADLDSNDYHTLLVRQGLEGIADKPLGHGPGTAGLVSIQNPAGGQLTENYYVQIGYEVGVFGLLLFVGLNVWLYVRLWQRRDQFGLVLCAAFWAYVLINMLLHSWSNEAVAAQWWILTGLALVATKPGGR